jgi:pimeloyl-ACP methyl ester carboxylesterase
MGRVTSGACAIALAAACALVANIAGASAATPDRIVDVPVTFAVQNVNRTDATCAADGATYAVHGHLVAPRAALAAAGPHAVTLYLHGSIIPESVWRFPLSGYDWALAEAQAGHASVTIDQIGFGASGLPDGLAVCFGSWADAAHQVISQLRSGAYRIGTAGGVRFDRVALAGYCIGGLIAQIEAYTFKDVDAFVEMSSAFDQGQSPAATLDELTNPDGPAAVCARGGQQKFPGGPNHYSYVLAGREPTLWLYNADPAVVAGVIRGHEREPCSEGPSLVTALAADRAHMQEITAPVLLVFGNQDAIFPPPDGERQKALYSGSRDVTLVQLDRTGHALQLGRTAPLARAAVSRWLRARGF